MLLELKSSFSVLSMNNAKLLFYLVLMGKVVDVDSPSEKVYRV